MRIVELVHGLNFFDEIFYDVGLREGVLFQNFDRNGYCFSGRRRPLSFTYDSEKSVTQLDRQAEKEKNDTLQIRIVVKSNDNEELTKNSTSVGFGSERSLGNGRICRLLLMKERKGDSRSIAIAVEIFLSTTSWSKLTLGRRERADSEVREWRSKRKIIK